mmetsp:Transcript_305/g.726  ORF Transcript_305/g.726 Transcript_305/m.726 type:complete len:91 (+) Transcript_305:824-1096(+)
MLMHHHGSYSILVTWLTEIRHGRGDKRLRGMRKTEEFQGRKHFRAMPESIVTIPTVTHSTYSFSHVLTGFFPHSCQKASVKKKKKSATTH